MAISDDTKIEVPDNIVCKKVKEDLVLLNVKDGTYYKLNVTAGDFWKKLEGGSTFGEAAAELIEQYDVEAETLKADLMDILTEIEAEGLVGLTA